MTDRIPVFDNVNNTKAVVLHWYPPTFQPANPAAAGAYFAGPVETQVYALLLWPDNTIHVQSVHNIVATIYP